MPFLQDSPRSVPPKPDPLAPRSEIPALSATTLRTLSLLLPAETPCQASPPESRNPPTLPWRIPDLPATLQKSFPLRPVNRTRSLSPASLQTAVRLSPFSLIPESFYLPYAVSGAMHAPEILLVPATHPLHDHNQRPCSDQHTADKGLHGKLLMQKQKSQYQRNHHTQLIDGNHL